MGKPVTLGAHSALANPEVIKLLEEEGCDPLRILAQIAMGNLGADVDHRLSAAKELAQYVHAKKRSVDISAHIKGNVTYNIVSFGDVAPEAAAELGNQAKAMLTAYPKSRAAMKEAIAESKELPALVIEAVRDNAETFVARPIEPSADWDSIPDDTDTSPR